VFFQSGRCRVEAFAIHLAESDSVLQLRMTAPFRETKGCSIIEWARFVGALSHFSIRMKTTGGGENLPSMAALLIES
jgi:hypothetical protein